VEPDLAQKCIRIIQERLPPNGRIVLLSLTGSRAFGWAWKNFDYDVHGLIAAPKWWDWVHLGIDEFDINLFELRHLFELDLPYKHGETIMNLANPFYADPQFQWSEILELVTPDFFDPLSFDHQLDWFRRTRCPRAALHVYRLALVPIHFLRFGVFELNVFKVAEKLGLSLPGMHLCRELYIAPYSGGKRSELTDEEYLTVIRELMDLRKLLDEEKRKSSRRWDQKKFEELRRRVYSTFYGAP